MVTLFAFIWLTSLVFVGLYHFSSKIDTIDVAKNLSRKPVGLRDRADQQLPHTASFSPGETLPITAKGNRWAYVEKNGIEYAVPIRHVSIDHIRIQNTLTIKRVYYEQLVATAGRYHWFFYAASLLGIFSLVYRITRLITPHTSNADSDRDTISRQELEKRVIEARLSESQKFEREKLELREEHDRVIKRRDEDERKRIDRVLKAHEESFREDLKNEIDIQYRGKIQELEIAASKIRHEYEARKKSAAVLGVDLDDTNLPNLVKGREFEVFCAKYFHNHPDFLIKRWTPDKGFSDDIYVENNGDPDFILEITIDDEKHLISVECKYSSVYYCMRYDEYAFNWGLYKKYKRYKEFREREGMEVLILVGAGGPASDPDQLYLGKLFELRKASEYGERFKINEVPLSKGTPFKVSRDQLTSTIQNVVPSVVA